MKKLLSLLTIPAIATSVPAPLLANAPVERVKRDINKLTPQLIRNKRESNKVYDFKIKGLKKVRFVISKQKNNITRVNILKMDNINLNGKLPELRNLENLSFLFTQELQNNQSKQKEIKQLITAYGQETAMRNIWVINKNITIKAQGTNLKYFEYGNDKVNYQLSSTNNFEVEIERDSTDNLDNLDWVKQQNQFNLIDGSKTKTWTRPDLITVDGELNITVANPKIDKVVFDDVQQSQTNKQWNINIKPETSERDHNLQVTFTLDGKQYTSEIIVSMQAKIDPPKPIVKENLSDVIKFADENNLGNILDNSDDTINATITPINSRIIDFSQIEFTKKDNHSATLIAKPDSKSYQGSVVVKYNVVPATIVDLKIDLQPTSPSTQIDKDYLGQIDTSTITNPVNTFYYANSESKITMLKPTASSVITGAVYGCDDKWAKNGQQINIDQNNGIKLDGSQLGAINGKYLIDLKNELGHTNKIYLQIVPKQAITNYFDTPNGKQFEQWAKDNKYDNIRGYRASQLNNLFALSKTWKQSLAHLKLQLDPFVVENIKNVTQDEIDTYKTKLLVNIKSQVEKYVPDVIENTDYVINTNNLVVDDWTASKDVIVQAVDSSMKLLNFTTATISVQQKDHQVPPILNTEQTPEPDNNGGNSKLWIIGVVVGVLGLGGIVYLLFHKFIFNKYILPKIYARRQQKVVAQSQWEHDDREEVEEQAHKQAKREEKQNSKNDNFKFLNDKELLRLTGIKQNTFNKMLDILKEAELEKFKKGGKANKLSLENRLLMTLSYWQGSHTYFHLGKSFGISETNCYRNIKWIENTLIKHPNFQQLAGQKTLINKHFND
ncbi:transposase family protein [Spiroplasma endosymbiont of Clivina fossor]|uniref:helix-turn-helix domain-containing protein n=1 Tax=Spiroplasma endosymbiont of Clivina fossor TaxID=3066282 RepID=UPI00313D2180